MGKYRVHSAAALCALAVVLWADAALAGTASIGGLPSDLLDPWASGGGGGGANLASLTQLKSMIQSNIATVASIAILGIGLFLAFAKSGWMELVGSLAFIAVLGISVTWAASNTSSFFGAGGLLV